MSGTTSPAAGISARWPSRPTWLLPGPWRPGTAGISPSLQLRRPSSSIIKVRLAAVAMVGAGAARTCNEQLYALLAKCHTLYFDMCGKNKDAVEMSGALESVVSNKGYPLVYPFKPQRAISAHRLEFAQSGLQDDADFARDGPAQTVKSRSGTRNTRPAESPASFEKSALHMPASSSPWIS